MGWELLQFSNRRIAVVVIGGLTMITIAVLYYGRKSTVVSSVVIEPAGLVELCLNQSQQLQVELYDTDGNVIDIQADPQLVRGGLLRWQSEEPGVASVDNYGLVDARTFGSTTISVTAGNVTGTVTVKVCETCFNGECCYPISCDTYGPPIDDRCGGLAPCDSLTVTLAVAGYEEDKACTGFFNFVSNVICEDYNNGVLAPCHPAQGNTCYLRFTFFCSTRNIVISTVCIDPNGPDESPGTGDERPPGTILSGLCDCQ